MSEEEAFKWAARISDKPVEEVDFDYAIKILYRYLKRRADISIVYPNALDDSEAMIMVVTQRHPHYSPRRGDDPKKSEQFIKGRVDALVGKALTNDGVQNIQFITAVGEL
ncbi:hypothetical protein D9615_004837 [Tricholomella constricta]|uniref:Uncharacterized protein n=1 Tax=Tricholomella constricta TaxID=117010 RepID=A0A8H5M710_9AGAR|nr:hypothetical protein D9615_004837 [Tricholomella constricta]